MKYKIDSYSALPCQSSIFVINGIKMDKDDFGENLDDGCPDFDCDCYGCHNKHFVSFKLDKIKENLVGKIILTDDEIREIADKLEEIFDVGDCGWCS